MHRSEPPAQTPSPTNDADRTAAGFASKGSGSRRDPLPSEREDNPDAHAESFAARHELPYLDELKRKGVHLIALIIPLTMWAVGEIPALLLLMGTSCLALAADVLRVRSRPFARGLYRVFGFMMRPEECPPVGGPVVLNGATWVLLSATLLVLLFPLDVAVVSFTVFMISDAAAAVIGRRWGRRRWRGTTRTVEGSAAFYVVGVAAMVLFGWIPLWITLATVFAGAAAEIPSRPLNDNIRVPVVMAAAILLCRLIAP